MLFGQKQGGHGSICFGDDPDLLCVHNLIATDQAKPILEAQFVFRLVFLAEIAPVAAKMSRQEFQSDLLICSSNARAPGIATRRPGENSGIVGREFMIQLHSQSLSAHRWLLVLHDR